MNSRITLLFIGCFIVSCLLENSYANEELAGLIAEALAYNPDAVAAQHAVERALAERDVLGGFFDPQLVATADQNNSPLGFNQTFGQVGTELAVLPGIYLGAQVQESYYRHILDIDDVTDEDHLFQSLAGVQLGVPLIQDFGFRQWKLSDQQAVKKYDAAKNQYRAVSQRVRQAVEQQYIDVLEAIAGQQVAHAATGRAEKLLREAKELVRLKTLPEYQVFPAQSEVALRREKEVAALQTYETRVSGLYELLGRAAAGNYSPLEFPDTLVAWAGESDLPKTYSETKALKYRGDYLQVLDQIEAVEAEKNINLDKLRSDLSFTVETTLQGEDPDAVIARDNYLSDRNVGALVGLTWKRPLGYRAERAKVRATSATLAERRENLRQVEIRIRTELQVAHQKFKRAQERLRVISESVTASRQTLESEEERFRLGEGRSRNVLDAQKDLTEALQQQTIIAAELLRAHFNFLFATGYANDQLQLNF